MNHLCEETAVWREGSLFDVFPQIRDRWYSGRMGNVRYRSPLGSSRRAGRAVSLEGLREEERRRKDKSLLDVKLLGLCHTSASSLPCLDLICPKGGRCFQVRAVVRGHCMYER